MAYAAAGLLNQLVALAHGESASLGPAGALLAVADALERAGFLNDDADGDGLVDLKVQVLSAAQETEIRRQAEEGDALPDDEWRPEAGDVQDDDPVVVTVPQDFADRVHGFMVAHGAVAGRTLALAVGICSPPRDAQRLEHAILAKCGTDPAALAAALKHMGVRRGPDPSSPSL